jgi:hypothetical protein
MQKKWNNFRKVKTFLSGKYSKVLLKIDNFNGFDGSLHDLLPKIEDATNESFCYSTFRKNMSKYKYMGLLDYSISSPIKIKEPLIFIKSYLKSISEDEDKSLSLVSKQLIENNIGATHSLNQLGQKNYSYKNTKNIDLFDDGAVKRPKQLYQKKVSKTKDKHKQKSIKIQNLDYIRKIDENSESHSEKLNFILNLHKESQKGLSKKNGPNSIFNGKLYSRILSSLKDVEGSSKKDFSIYLKEKYDTKSAKSYEHYLLHLKHLNIIKEKDRKIYLDETGKILVEYFDEYGVNNVLKWVYNK